MHLYKLFQLQKTSEKSVKIYVLFVPVQHQYMLNMF